MTLVEFFHGETWIRFEFDALLQYWSNVFPGVKYSMSTIALVLGKKISAKLLPHIVHGVRFIEVIKKDVCHGPDCDVDHALLCSKRLMVISAMEIKPIQ